MSNSPRLPVWKGAHHNSFKAVENFSSYKKEFIVSQVQVVTSLPAPCIIQDRQGSKKEMANDNVDSFHQGHRPKETPALSTWGVKASANLSDFTSKVLGKLVRWQIFMFSTVESWPF